MSASRSLNEDGRLCLGGLSLGKNEEAPFLPFLIRSVMGQHFVAVLLLVADRKRSEHMQCKLYVLLFFHRFIYKVLPSLGMASSVASWASARGPVSVVLRCTDRGLTENRCRLRDASSPPQHLGVHAQAGNARAYSFPASFFSLSIAVIAARCSGLYPGGRCDLTFNLLRRVCWQSATGRWVGARGNESMGEKGTISSKCCMAALANR